jgi:nucleoside-diphosphate-sugar epimerase
MKKTILIIGANSVVAEETIDLLSKGNNVVTAGRNNCDIYVDITKKIDIPNGVDIVINFAAAFGGESDNDFTGTVDTNIKGTINICRAAKKASVKQTILISSIFALLNEGSPFYNLYSITKKQADELAVFYCKKNKMQLTILRPAQIYGDSDKFAKHQPFLYRIIDHAEQGEDINIYGNNDAKRNYIHSRDVAEIIKRVITETVEGVYTCAYPSNTSYSEIGKTAQKIFNKDGRILFLKNKNDIPDNVFTKDLTLYEKLNYHPKISISEGIERIKNFREKSLR